MSPIKQIIRAWIAVLIGLGHLGSLPQVDVALVRLMLAHGHEHEHHTEVVQQGSQTYLVFHHHDHDHDQPLDHHDEDHNHVCHVAALSAPAVTTLPSQPASHIHWAQSWVAPSLAKPAIVTRAAISAPAPARVTPSQYPGILEELRTVVLRV